ncbi:hypothetical protein HDU96_007514 [Phlyctochytrium bullatum]|nr:hypothetical protein HDU96_007514 [Phlyctochytrium bullatum]
MKWTLLGSCAALTVYGLIFFLVGVTRNLKFTKVFADVSRLGVFFGLCRDILVPIYLFATRNKLEKSCIIFAIQSPADVPPDVNCNQASFVIAGIVSGFALLDIILTIYADVIIYSFRCYLEDLHDELTGSLVASKYSRLSDPAEEGKIKAQKHHSYGSTNNPTSDDAPLLPDPKKAPPPLSEPSVWPQIMRRPTEAIWRNVTRKATWGSSRVGPESPSAYTRMEDDQPPMPKK